jgi:uncharacterized OB-fold protein
MDRPVIPLPLCLDFYPLQDEKSTRIYKFWDNLREGKFTTTRCKGCKKLLWQPRVVCPHCNSDDMEWVEMPKTGKLYSFSAMMAGAPTGLTDLVPITIGIVKMDETGFNILTRINAKLDELEIDMPMELETFEIHSDRIFYRFKPKK